MDRLAVAPRDSGVELISAFASARLEHPELAPMLEFYEAVQRASGQVPARAALSPEETRDVGARLESGQCALTWEWLSIDAGSLSRLSGRFVEIIRHYRPDWPPATPPGVEECVRTAMRWLAGGDPPVGPADEEDAGQLATRFATSAYLQEGADQLQPVVENYVWGRPTCPYCGGRPALAFLTRVDGSRRLFCPRCHQSWSYRRTACPFCEAPGSAYYAGPSPDCRLYVCEACRRYLKTIDLRATGREPDWPVEHIVTVGMDLSAQQAGFSPG